MKITALTPQKNSSRYNLYIDEKFVCGVAAEICLSENLFQGKDISEKEVEKVIKSDSFWKARESAINLISYRPRSVGEVRKKLLGKKHSPEITEECITFLLDRGLIDDTSFASLFTRDKLRGKKGKRRIVQELRAKGISTEFATTAVNEVMDDEDIDEADIAVEATQQWIRKNAALWNAALENPGKMAVAKRRLYGYLSRRGFAGEALSHAVKSILE